MKKIFGVCGLLVFLMTNLCTTCCDNYENEYDLLSKSRVSFDVNGGVDSICIEYRGEVLVFDAMDYDWHGDCEKETRLKINEAKDTVIGDWFSLVKVTESNGQRYFKITAMANTTQMNRYAEVKVQFKDNVSRWDNCTIDVIRDVICIYQDAK